jgi:predicted MPP superfamily phosphohydrolase
MRIIFFLILILALDLYAFQAFRSLAGNWQSTARWTVYILYWSVTAFALFFMLASASGWTDQWSKSMLMFSRAFVFITYLSKVLVCALLLIDDGRRLVLWLYELAGGTTAYSYSRSRFLSTAGLFFGAIPFTSMIYGMVRNRYRYKIYRDEVTIEGLPEGLDGMKIVQISDIHSGSLMFSEPVRNAVDLINAEAADLVFFTGDLVNNVADEMDQFMDVFQGIRANHGIYSVLGNHDYGEYVRWPNAEAREANMEKLKGIHKTLGWRLLLNEHERLQISNEEVAVIGVENYSAHPRFPKYGDLPKAYEGTENAKLKLLLSHDPSHWKDQVVKEFSDIDLTFSGHTHGMQFGVEIPGFIKWSPIQYVYKEWAGLYKDGRQFLYVNRGLGFLGYPGRVGILPEITSLILRKA